MTKITDITKFLWFPCPQCKKEQIVTEWNVAQKCRHTPEGGATCGTEFSVPYDPELLLTEAVKLKKDYDHLLETRRPAKEKPAKLQKLLTGGWILVPQGPETT